MPKEVETVKCPTCGWHHPIRRTGIMRLQRGESADQPKGEFVFGDFDLDEAASISIREVKGRGGGLPDIGRVTLAEAQTGGVTQVPQELIPSSILYVRLRRDTSFTGLLALPGNCVGAR